MPTIPLTASSASSGLRSNRSLFLYSNRFGIFSLFRSFSDTTLTAVSGHKLTSPGKTVDGQAALVGTAFAFCHGGRELQMIDLVDGEHGGLYTVLITLTGDQCSTESTHDTGDIRADCFTSGNLFETAKNGIVVERTACTTMCLPSSEASETLITL